MKFQNNRSVCLLFYDINQINFFKYTPGLLEELGGDSKFTVLLCYEEETTDRAALEFLSGFENIKVGLFRSITSVFKKYQVDTVVVNAQRIPDSLCVSYAKSRGIPTLMIQHGMYNGHLKRSKELYFRKLFKTFKYFLYSLRVGMICDKNIFATSVKFIKAFSLRDSYKDLLEDYEQIYADHVHVYGRYWIEYHESFFGYREDRTRFSIVGYPELSKQLGQGKFTFCYIAQSLYEDGRITLRELSKPLKVLKELNDNYSVVVKRHPRSLDEVYEEYGLDTTDVLPDADIFIGHYSSLLALPMALGKKVALMPLSGHVIPDYFQQSAYSADSSADLVSLLHEANHTQSIEEVFEFPIDPKDHKARIVTIIGGE
jgi:hypothetical protein